MGTTGVVREGRWKRMWLMKMGRRDDAKGAQGCGSLHMRESWEERVWPSRTQERRTSRNRVGREKREDEGTIRNKLWRKDQEDSLVGWMRK